MSQDTHLFSVRRPRETLGIINYNSSIPQPASALKRSNSISNLEKSGQIPHTAHHARSASSSRMLLAPNRPQQPLFQRSSSGDLGRSSTVQRASTSNNLFGGVMSSNRMSYAPGSAVTSHVQPPPSVSQSVQRRSSVYSRPSTTPHQSFFTPAPVLAVPPRDVRPLKEPQYRAKLGQELLDYLTQNNFEMDTKHPLGQNTFKSPTLKDFTIVFQWLYHRIEPAHRFQKPLDTELPIIIKQLRYPYERNITKSAISAPGGANNLPTFIGLLHWLMQLAMMLDRYDAGSYDEACAEAGVDVHGDRIIFRFLSNAYRDWLQVDAEDEEDDSDKLLQPHIQAMAADFEAGNQQYAEEMKILEAENVALQRQIEEMEKSAPDVATLDRQFSILGEDLSKFEKYNAAMDEKVKKYEKAIERLLSEIGTKDVESKEAQQEKESLQEAVDKQGITVQDIDHMNGERDRLQNGVEVAKIRLEEVKKKVSEKEIETSAKLEELERLVDRYNSLCYSIALVPSTAVNAKGEDYELRLNIQADLPFSSSQLGKSSINNSISQKGDRLLSDPTTGYHPAHVLNLDLRGTLKQTFSHLRKEINKRRNTAKDVDEENHRLLDELSEAIDDKRNEVEALEHRVRAAEEEFEKIKDVTSTQKVASDAQIEKMEKELGRMRGGLGESLALVEQREMATNIEYEQLTLRANALREELHTEIERMLNDIIKFKVHVQKSLEDYEAFVVEEVELELGSGADLNGVGEEQIVEGVEALELEEEGY
ncbi:MAG: kinetochore-associated Ndc80 complex subunit ndc80 [Icmadophila ericetorum]|nr:kinetochore-associated Ndc80 complex subunit ndc80 [Icmadophila ericetorum]